MELVVGRDTKYECTWQLDAGQYEYLKSLLLDERAFVKWRRPQTAACSELKLTWRERAGYCVGCALPGGWNCRVAMTNDANSFRIPFTLPLWGVVEPSHIHVDNHINMVFHMDQGWIIGAAAYPSTRAARGAPSRPATRASDGSRPARGPRRERGARFTCRPRSSGAIRRGVRDRLYSRPRRDAVRTCLCAPV